MFDSDNMPDPIKKEKVMTPFEVARLYAGIVAGVVLGWLVASPPERFASIQWLNALSAIGTVGAAVGAIWIATNQRRSHLRDQRLAGALQIMKRRHWMYLLIQELQTVRKFNWPTTVEDQRLRDAVSAAEADLSSKLEWRSDLNYSLDDDLFGDRAADADRIVANAEKSVKTAKTTLGELEQRSKDGRAMIHAIAEKIDALDTIPANGDPKFLQLAYLARSSLDMAIALVWDYTKEANLRGNLKDAESLLWDSYKRINAADALVKKECEDFMQRDKIDA